MKPFISQILHSNIHSQWRIRDFWIMGGGGSLYRGTRSDDTTVGRRKLKKMACLSKIGGARHLRPPPLDPPLILTQITLDCIFYFLFDHCFVCILSWYFLPGHVPDWYTYWKLLVVDAAPAFVHVGHELLSLFTSLLGHFGEEFGEAPVADVVSVKVGSL